MKKKYIQPESFTVSLIDGIMFNDDNSEPGITENIGAKENEGFFDDTPFGSLWEDDPVEDPFAIGD